MAVICSNNSLAKFYSLANFGYDPLDIYITRTNPFIKHTGQNRHLYLIHLFQNNTVKPKKGDALLFFSLYPSAVPDSTSLHGGCPVLQGEKWSATKWIHVDSFDKIIDNGGNCKDQHENCERWAALGECAKNKEYMEGTPELPGYCRRSCKLC